MPYLTSLGKDNSLRAQVSYLKPAEPIHYFSVGNGTADKPYQIKTESDLKNLSKLTNEGTPDETNGGALYSTLNYTVANDITLSVEWTPIGTWNSSNATEQKPFSGNFDGASHTISGLKIINTKDYQGFFGCSINANIKNIRLSIEEINVTGNAQNTGGLVGYFNAKEGFGTVENCTVTGGTVSGNLIVGGLIGYASNFDSLNIQNCSADVNVASSGTGINVGGLIGSLSNDGSGILNLRNCFASGDVSGKSYSVGGLIGIADDNSIVAEGLTIQGCYASGDVSGKSYSVGGLIGQINKHVSIQNCYAAGSVSSDDTSVGGLIGYAYNVADKPITVQNCYSLGIVTAAGSMVGGLIGEANAKPGAVILTNSAALNPSVTGNSNVGRVVGCNTTNVTITTCFGWEGMLINGAAASENYNNGWHAESGYIWDNESTYQGFITDFNTNWKMSENPNYKLPILKWQSEKSAAGFNAVYLKPFNISFNSNGGDGGTMTNQSVTGNVSVNLKPNTFTKSGYEFNGWSTTSGGAKIYNDTDSIKITEDTTLYANWTNVPKSPIVSGTNYLTEGTAGIYNISSANAGAIYVDYGDGEPISIYSGSSAVGKHIFHKEGSYTLKATGYNAAGKSSETAFMITVAAKRPEPANPVINDTLQSIASGGNATAVVLIIVDSQDTGSAAPVIILQDSTANPPQSSYGNLSANNGIVAIVNISLQNLADPHNLSHMAMFTIRLNKTAVNTLTNSHPENISVYRNTQFGGEWTQTPVYSVYNQSANTNEEYAYDVKTPGFSFFTFVAAADVSTPHILPPEPEPYDDDDWQPLTATATPVKTKTPTPAATAEQTKAPENTQTAVPTYVEPTMTKTAEPAATAKTSPIGIAGIGLGVLGALIALRRK
ncbi:MAG: GLUG motif-containing protein [Methanocorpusculum sp.]|nr:GLUG motif-containing protein [Methanocorpusculum sp.]